jgi:hypothetical protein
MIDVLSNLCIVGLAVSAIAFLVILAAAGSSRRMYNDRTDSVGISENVAPHDVSRRPAGAGGG